MDVKPCEFGLTLPDPMHRFDACYRDRRAAKALQSGQLTQAKFDRSAILLNQVVRILPGPNCEYDQPDRPRQEAQNSVESAQLDHNVDRFRTAPHGAPSNNAAIGVAVSAKLFIGALMARLSRQPIHILIRGTVVSFITEICRAMRCACAI